jgi:hypothetical protein
MMPRSDAAHFNPLIDTNSQVATLESVISALQEMTEVAVDPGDMPPEGLRNLLSMVVRVNQTAIAALSYEKHSMQAASLAIATR